MKTKFDTFVSAWFSTFTHSLENACNQTTRITTKRSTCNEILAQKRLLHKAACAARKILTCISDAFDVFWDDVEDDHFVAALEQVARHVTAHVAQTHEPDSSTLLHSAACNTSTNKGLFTLESARGALASVMCCVPWELMVQIGVLQKHWKFNTNFLTLLLCFCFRWWSMAAVRDVLDASLFFLQSLLLLCVRCGCQDCMDWPQHCACFGRQGPAVQRGSHTLLHQRYGCQARPKLHLKLCTVRSHHVLAVYCPLISRVHHRQTLEDLKFTFHNF